MTVIQIFTQVHYNLKYLETLNYVYIIVCLVKGQFNFQYCIYQDLIRVKDKLLQNKIISHLKRKILKWNKELTVSSSIMDPCVFRT